MAEKKKAAASNSARKRKTDKVVRNTRNAQVKVMLNDTDKNYKPFRVFLQPRGQRGDMTTVPARLSEHPQLINFIDLGILEVVPATEARGITYERPRPPRFNGVEVQTVETFRDSQNSVVVGHQDEAGRMTRVPRAEREQRGVPQASDGTDRDTQKLVDNGVMPPLPKRK